MLKAHLLIRARQGTPVPDGLQGNEEESRKGKPGKRVAKGETEGWPKTLGIKQRESMRRIM